MNLTDTHCHLDFNRFDADRDEVLARAWETGLTRILIPGLTATSSRAAVKLAESHPKLFAAVGVHPNDVDKFNVDTPARLRELAKNPKVVAIGEIGLDYYWDSAPHDHQQKVLQEQLALAAEIHLPVVLHFREKGDAPHGECAEDLIKILEDWVNKLRVGKNSLAERPGVLHSFCGSHETAQRAIQLGFYIGVTGPVTFKKARERQEIIAALPLERLLIETDAPFLAPHPHRGQRNEPAFVREIADKIGQLHSRNLEEVAAATSASAAKLFSWGEMD
ncbi:MAG: hydrolase TatD [Anaerolinea sp.]|nr:hydrolase TatD [Anaerolinea sp.]